MNSRLTNLQKDVLVGLAAIVAVIAFALIGYALKQSSQQRDTLQSQVAFLCSTTQTLDELVTTSVKSEKLSLSNGTYTRLEQSGLLPSGFTESVRNNIRAFEHAHRHLILSEGVCK